MRRIDGKCHCGNISYQFHWPEPGPHIPVRACSCTFCMKHSAVYTSHGDTFEGVDKAELISSVTNFDGESVEGRLERRKRNWTPRVNIELKQV